MKRGEPVVVANGMVFGYGSGEETKQSWPDIGLNFDSSIRAAKSTHATLYVLDAQTGDELYSSGEQITSFNHFSGLTVANGRVYSARTTARCTASAWRTRSGRSKTATVFTGDQERSTRRDRDASDQKLGTCRSGRAGSA